MVTYHMGYQWHASAGYQYYARLIDTPDLRNEVVYNVPYLAISYSW